MGIEFQCSCGTRLRTAEANVGKKTRCPRCGAAVKIAPAPPESVPKPLEAVAVPVPSPAAANRTRRVVAKPATPQSEPGFDPLGLGDLSFPSAQAPAPAHWSAPGYSSAPGRRRAKKKSLLWLWIGLGVGSLALLAVVAIGGIGLAVVRSLKNSPLAGAFSASGSSAANSSSAAPASKKAEGPPVSESEAEAVVKRFVQAVRDHDFNLCKKLFNVDRFYEGVADEVGLSGADRRGFLTAAARQPQLWDQVYPIFSRGGEYVVLRPIKRGGELRVVVRLSSEQTGLNYHEFITRRNDQGEVEIADIYVLVAGSTYGETLREVVSAMFAWQNNSLFGRLGGVSKEAAENAKTLERVKTLGKTSPQLALKEFNKLPADMRQKKTLMIVRMQLSAAVGPAEYAQAYQDFRSAFPNDASLDLLSIDYYIDRGETQNALAAAERLNAYVGGDPLLDQRIARLRGQ